MYSYFEKLALDVAHAIQWLHHYIVLRRTIVITNVNPFQHILSRRIIIGKYNRWIFILQDFGLGFDFAKSKKSSAFAELMLELAVEDEGTVEMPSFIAKHLFLIISEDPWYGDILVYLQT